jgi:formate hydrogenlyase subunit 3/multisubunit Na+/H+ antiporter MnhD subunit
MTAVFVLAMLFAMAIGTIAYVIRSFSQEPVGMWGQRRPEQWTAGTALMLTLLLVGVPVLIFFWVV